MDKVKSLLMDQPTMALNQDGSPNPNKLKNFGILLDNHYANIAERDSKDSSVWDNKNLPVMMRIFEGLIAHEIVGVQALTTRDHPTIDVLRRSIGGDDITIQQNIEIQRSKLRARWAYQSADEAMMLVEGSDIDIEIMAALAHEITVEYDQKLLLHLKYVAGAPATIFDMKAHAVSDLALMIENPTKLPFVMNLRLRTGVWSRQRL